MTIFRILWGRLTRALQVQRCMFVDGLPVFELSSVPQKQLLHLQFPAQEVEALQLNQRDQSLQTFCRPCARLTVLRLEQLQVSEYLHA
jgi:hypothetical protein